jgi:predicted RNA binding protein YcfA (HicA-like mRNA interferase family)
LKAISGKDLAKLARKKGWELVRVQGSHHIFKKQDRTERLVIPIHGNKTLKSGLQRSLDENHSGIRGRTIEGDQRT